MKLIQAIKEKAYLAGFLVGIGKIGMAVLSGSWLIFIHAIYNIIKSCANHYARVNDKTWDKTMFTSGLFVIAASAVYLIYSIYIYVFGSNASYHMYVAIGIAAVTTYELTVAILGLRRARREKDARHETVRYINLASALISVSLTQTAILSFTNKGMEMSGAYAIGDAIFGFLALNVGIAMLLRTKRLKSI